MNYLIPAVLGTALLGTVPAFAQELVGGDLSIGHSFMLDDTGYSKTGIGGSLAFAFGQVGVQGDMAGYSLNEIDGNGSAFTVHGSYLATPTLALGGFYGFDRYEGNTKDFFGAEIAGKSNRVGGEAYYAFGDDEDFMGVNGRFAVSDSLGLSLGLDRLTPDNGSDVTKLSVGADFAFTRTASVYGEFGTISNPFPGQTADGGYIGIGARINFGSEGSPTFGRRGILDMIPGM
ncbi:MAG: hypothetical protein DI533_02560 [Cereibacter sphaeroides]|uniref:Porin domain-containing protein n=1 Tax=Cereibacter sphaeroides TaxID=1063 RepID=A0A2W5S992_CERSP|nr:MAG: hypothetical protein DI533_02560 [Cereibacter sphaeroides]